MGGVWRNKNIEKSKLPNITEKRNFVYESMGRRSAFSLLLSSYPSWREGRLVPAPPIKKIINLFIYLFAFLYSK